MANPAIGQASRDRMASNHKSLSARFTFSPMRRCDGITKAGERCWKDSQYGANSTTPIRPTWDDTHGRNDLPVDRHYCHTHATALLNAESEARRKAQGF